jgi:anti-sigma-K factor RskA
MTIADDHNDDVALAGEYALHLLDAEERRAFEDRLKNEPSLRMMVADWDTHFGPLSDEIFSVTPPALVKSHIEDVLFGEPVKARWGFSIWQMVMGGGFAAALGLAVFVVLPLSNVPDPFTPSFTADLSADDQSLVVMASYAPDTGILRINRQTGGARPGRVLELWLIADGTTVPISLGVLPSESATDIVLPAALSDAISGGTLAISDEPVGGSTTGAPTGDVLAAGAVISI